MSYSIQQRGYLDYVETDFQRRLTEHDDSYTHAISFPSLVRRLHRRNLLTLPEIYAFNSLWSHEPLLDANMSFRRGGDEDTPINEEREGEEQQTENFEGADSDTVYFTASSVDEAAIHHQREFNTSSPCPYVFRMPASTLDGAPLITGEEQPPRNSDHDELQWWSDDEPEGRQERE